MVGICVRTSNNIWLLGHHILILWLLSVVGNKILPEEDTVTLVFSWAWFHTAQETYIHSEDLRCYTIYFHQSSLMTKQARDNDQLFLTGEYNFKTESMIYLLLSDPVSASDI
jgi:hypothetical protein